MTDDVIAVVVIDPARNFGKPMFAASGACVSAVLDRLRAGETLESVVYDFDLTEIETHFLSTLRAGEVVGR